MKIDNKFAILSIGEEKHKLPIYIGTDGKLVCDITKLFAESQICTYDPGFKSTASCKSAITYIDGAKSILQHRGYSIQYLAEHHTFEEVFYLLFFKKLPQKAELDSLHKKLTGYQKIDKRLLNFIDQFDKNSHPMGMLVSIMGAIAADHYNDFDIYGPIQREELCIQIVAKFATIAAQCFRKIKGKDFVEPKPDYSIAENLLYMLFSTKNKDYKMNPIVVDAMNKLLILHADHEQNASTSTVRMAGSSGVNLYAAIAAGVASLWGPSHGGANEAVLKMLKEIGSKDKIPQFIEKVKRKETRLMGFGHRVYSNYDPRAGVIKDSCDEVLSALKIDNPLLDIAKELEQIALQDEYFTSRNLFPNVDFYSGIIYSAIGFPVEMFTVMFAIARTAGWTSQWCEMMEDPDTKIGRPRQLYIGDLDKK